MMEVSIKSPVSLRSLSPHSNNTNNWQTHRYHDRFRVRTAAGTRAQVSSQHQCWQHQWLLCCGFVCRARNGDWKAKNPKSRNSKNLGGNGKTRKFEFQIFGFSNCRLSRAQRCLEGEKPEKSKIQKIWCKPKHAKIRIFEFLNFRVFEFSNFRIAVCRVRNGDWKAKNQKSRKFGKN